MLKKLVLFQERRRPRRFGGDEAGTTVRAEGAYRAKQRTAPPWRGGYLLLLVILFLVFPFSSLAEETSEQFTEYQRQLIENQEEQKELQQKISNLHSEEVNLQNQISQFDNQIYLTTLQIDEAQTKINAKEGELVLLSEDIGSLQERLGRLGEAVEFQDEVLNERVRARYKSSRISILEVIFGGESLREIVSRVKYLKVMEVQDRRLLNQMKTTRDNYRSQKALLEEKKVTVEVVKVEIEGQRAVLGTKKGDLDFQRGAKTDLLEVTQNDEKAFQRMLAEARAEQEAIESAVSRVVADLIEGGVPSGAEVGRGEVIGVQGSTGYSSGDHVHFGVYVRCGDDWCHTNPRSYLDSGQLSWPLDSFEVSQEYGATPEAQYLYVSKFHNGIDIYGPMYSAVKTAEGGTINYSIDSSGGRGALVYHSDELMTIYWHLR